ncbi:MAG: D-glycerate dehydrogenase [Candidatus Thermoplasmatota archaeon]|nr:D-glycerate dehydrogenase [Candidatus Thermoplasmatota archaeon]
MTEDGTPLLLVTRTLPEDGMERLQGIADLDVWEEDRPMPRSELLERVSDKDGVLCLLGDRIDREVMDRAPGLKVIGNYAVGVDNIDVGYATSRGIFVINTPGVLTNATADLAFGLILASARRLTEGDRYVRDGKFVSWGPRLMLGKDVHGATLGVVGAGKIGEAVLRRGRGFEMRLLYNSLSRKPSLEQELGALYRELDDLLREADFVSLNCPLTEMTHHLIGKRELSLMKKDAVLVNTARGPVVDEKALYDALSRGVIGGAGLDVFEEEPRVHPPLMELDNVIMVPHIGSATISTRSNMAFMVVEGIRSVLEGRMPDNIVNPEVFLR